LDIAKAWSAVTAAALSIFFVGGLWYSAFEKAWSRANGFTLDYLKTRNMPLVFSLSFFFSLIMALNLALFIGKSGFAFGLIAGLLTGIGWIVPAFGMVALFEKRPRSYLMVNGGYMATAFTLMGGIIGLWK
jgi:hypothetical protein